MVKENQIINDINIHNADKVIGTGVNGNYNVIGENIFIESLEYINLLQRNRHPSHPVRFLGEKQFFVGRYENIERIKQLFTKSNQPIAIIGEGGIGKSALAFKAMHDCERIFDYIIPVYFESATTFTNFLYQIAKALNLSVENFENKNIEEYRLILIDTLGKQKRVLIYADNYETISETLNEDNPSTDVIRINGFFEQLPDNTSILLTSRRSDNKLPIPLERIIRLDGLDDEESLKFFIHLTKKYFPTDPSEETQTTIKEILQKIWGHPLSIELIAKSYEGTGLDELKNIHRKISSVIDKLQENQRLRSLEECFNYSYNKLLDKHRQLLLSLTFFNSPFPISAPSEIFGFHESAIKYLYERSLLTTIDNDRYGFSLEQNERLYTFHPAIRKYLDDKIKDSKVEFKEKHNEKFSEYYFKLLTQIYFAMSDENYFKSLTIFNIIMEEENNEFQRLIQLMKPPSNNWLWKKGRILTMLGRILISQGMYTTAISYHNEALQIHNSLKDDIGLADDYRNIGSLYLILDNTDEALEYYQKALTIHESLRDETAIAADCSSIGSVLYRTNIMKALEYYQKALTIHESLRDDVGMADDYRNIGSLLLSQGFYDEAYDYLQKALPMHHNVENKTAIAADYVNLGIVCHVQGKSKKSFQYLEAALKIYEELGDILNIANCYNNLGKLYYLKNKSLLSHNRYDLDKALEYHQNAFELHKDVEDRIRIGSDYYNIGLVLLDMHKPKEAFEKFSRAQTIMRHEKQTYVVKYILEKLEKILSPYNKSQAELKLSDLNSKEFIIRQLRDLFIFFSISLAISMVFPFPYSLPVMMGVFIALNLYLRKRALKKIGITIENNLFRFSFSKNYYKEFILQQVKWFGISLGIGIAISMVFPFPYSLPVIIGVFIAFNFFLVKNALRKISLFEIYSTILSVYQCMNCKMKHSETTCPKCGSINKRNGAVTSSEEENYITYPIKR